MNDLKFKVLLERFQPKSVVLLLVSLLIKLENDVEIQQFNYNNQ